MQVRNKTICLGGGEMKKSKLLKLKPFVFERNFFILMSGVFINGLGSGIYSVAGMLLVLNLSGSVLYYVFAFFAISFAGSLSFLFSPLVNYAEYNSYLIFIYFLKAIIL